MADTHDITDNSESPDRFSRDLVHENPLNSGHPATQLGKYSIQAHDLHVGQELYVAVMYGTRGGFSRTIGLPAKSDFR